MSSKCRSQRSEVRGQGQKPEARSQKPEARSFSYFLLPISLFFFLASYFLLLTSVVQAANPQGWMKKIGPQRARRDGSRQTTIAAVRGVDEPSQVDPNARNFEAVETMEKRTIPQEKLNQFVIDGKLSKVKMESPAPGASKEAKP